MINSFSVIISFKYLVFSLEFSKVLDKIYFDIRIYSELETRGQHMLDLSLGN
jgi:hypothetical protein